ncbi:MAG: ATP-binding cassette domain-containing protein [Pirellulaceae bacterium]|nr:ATP-binding cassette domain-containing protein [Pirellulaceae bacterium]
MSQSSDQQQFRNSDAIQIAAVLERLCYAFNAPVEMVEIQQAVRTAIPPVGSGDSTSGSEFRLMQAAHQVGIRLAPTRLTLSDAMHLVRESFPVVVEESTAKGSSWWVIERKGRRAEAHKVDPKIGFSAGVAADISKIWPKGGVRYCYVAQPVLTGQALTAKPDTEEEHGHAGGHSGGHAHGHHGHAHLSPLVRFRRLLRLEMRDIATLVLFAFVAGVMGLAAPLAVESLVNTVAWGTYLQPLLVLSLLLFCFLGFAGFLRALQSVIAEVLQQRIFVRIVGDLGYRFARARREALDPEDAAELSNRFFDIMTIQKATASLLLDGMAIVIQTIIGLVLLAFYHPFLLGFDLVLVFSMTVITWALGRGAIRSAISESIVKYRIGHWMQDVLANPTAFHMNGGSEYAADHTNRLTVEYLLARRQHFRVLMRQFAFALTLQAIASTVLLGVGGWLVVTGELTLGQLVASELVVTAIVSAFAKIGKSLESFYDLMAAVDKVGHLLDLPIEPPPQYCDAGEGPAEVKWQNLALNSADPHHSVSNFTLPAGARLGITGCSSSGKSWLMEVLAGLRQPHQGHAEVDGLDVREADLISNGSLVSLARSPEIFHGTLLENIRLGRGWVSDAAVRSAMELVGIWDDALELPEGLDTMLQTGGYPLSNAQRALLMIARAIVGKPRLLLIDAALELLAPSERLTIWNRLSDKSHGWTIIISTYDQRILESCDQKIELGRSTGH